MTKSTTNRIKYAIEDSFPIVEINRLAVPERNAFKPIYKMHKWFARRSSCVFRAILLGCMKPLLLDENGKPLKSGAEIIMEEFYKDHTNDPDTKGKVIFDPFMGGGTTVVEALRLGCKVIGIDLNPVAWFIVKTEVEPVDIDELKAAFDRLAKRSISWSGKPLKETLLEQYKTECPCCGAGREEADIIYTFWVKSAICTNWDCKKEVPLFSDYIIAHKTPSIKYSRDAQCPECDKTFDWEIEPASLIAEPGLCVVSPTYSAGIGRTTARWASSANEEVKCPWCQSTVRPKIKHPKPERKKVPLTVLLCPHCYAVWQWRGNLPDEVSCPVCNRQYNPKEGYYNPKKKQFTCPSCGTPDKVISSVKTLPENKRLPLRPYAIEGYCPLCAGEIMEEIDEKQKLLFGGKEKSEIKRKMIDHHCLISKNKGKFFKRITSADLARYQKAHEIWGNEKSNLPYPKQAVPYGEKTKTHLIGHHYLYWHQMFNPRQLLCLSTLLKAIDEEPSESLKELLLSAFFNLLNTMSDFTTYIWQRDCTRHVFARHGFAPKNTSCESSVWGTKVGMGNFDSYFYSVVDAIVFASSPSDRRFTGRFDKKGKPILTDVQSGEIIYSTKERVHLKAADSKKLGIIFNDAQGHFVVTDPPYASNVNYSELADYFYVWLRLALSVNYPWFATEHTPKVDEIIENPTRGHSAVDFEEGLKKVFTQSAEKIYAEGLMAFTFHHAQGRAWEALLKAICDAGFVVESVYPIHGEPEASLHLLDQKAIAYDLIHVCRKREVGTQAQRRSWAGIRQEIRSRAREEIKAIEAGRYGGEPLSPADVNIILIGKCLELYSRHYGAVVDHEGNEVKLKDALEEIRMMVDQLVTSERPLPSELSDIDPESYVYLTCLCDRKEVKSDDVHKATRGIIEPDTLIKAGIMTRGRAGRGRAYEVKQPRDRFELLAEKFKDTTTAQQNLFGKGKMPKSKGKLYFIDYIHFLMAKVEGGDNAVPWLEHFRGESPRIRAACEYMASRNKGFAPTLKKILDMMDIGPLFTTK